MATLQQLLNQIPEDGKFNSIRFALQRIGETFPDELPEITPTRLQGWIDEINTGSGRARTADQIRDDIFKFVVGSDTIQQVLGVDAATAENLIVGGNDGGINFSDLVQQGVVDDSGLVGGGTGNETDTSSGNLPTVGRVPAGEEQADVGVGGGGVDPETQLTILTGKQMEWFFDSSSGKWFVTYGLPNSDRKIVLEADPDQLDALFGVGQRPRDFSSASLTQLTRDPDITFAGNIAEMEGEGSFEDEVTRVTALGLDDGQLPDWAKGDGAVLDIVFVAQSEGKSLDWMIDQISRLSSFKDRFPGIKEIQGTGNLTLPEAVTGFLEFEAGVRASVKSIGGNEGTVTPAVVGALLRKGYTLTTIQQVTTRFDRMSKFGPALQAFNDVLVANGQDPIVTLQEQFDFISGTAPADLYDIWEASSVAEAAAAAGLGDIFTAEDAMRFAIESEGVTSLGDATNAFQQSAQLLLRLRHQVEIGQFGLEQDDIIDLSLGRAPRSGTSASELQENMNRAILQAQGDLRGRAKPFIGFTQTGTPQKRSLSGLREGS